MAYFSYSSFLFFFFFCGGVNAVPPSPSSFHLWIRCGLFGGEAVSETGVGGPGGGGREGGRGCLSLHVCHCSRTFRQEVEEAEGKFRE